MRDPSQPTPPRDPQDENANARRVVALALSIAVLSTIVAWLVLGDTTPNGHQVLIALAATSFVLLGGYAWKSR